MRYGGKTSYRSVNRGPGWFRHVAVGMLTSWPLQVRYANVQITATRVMVE